MENKELLDLEKETLLLKYTQKQTTPEEAELVESWLNGSEEYRQESQAVRQVLKLKSRIDEHKSFRLPEAFVEVNRKLDKRSRKRLWISHLSRVAAIISIPLLISTLTFGYLFFERNATDIERRIKFIEVTSAPGMVTRLELPDNSKVCLNASSTLRYPTLFAGNTREVELTGEGYFEVQSDKEHPFFVTTKSGLRVMAHGTQFNVNTYDEREEVETILVEGKVDIHSSDKFIAGLKPGEKLSYNKQTKKYTIRQVNLYENTAWKDGKLVFRNTSLDEVFRILGHRFNVEIVLHNQKKENEYNCWATFTNETIYQIFSYLEEATPIRWKVNTMKQNNDSTFAKQQIDVWLK